MQIKLTMDSTGHQQPQSSEALIPLLGPSSAGIVVARTVDAQQLAGSLRPSPAPALALPVQLPMKSLHLGFQLTLPDPLRLRQVHAVPVTPNPCHTSPVVPSE